MRSIVPLSRPARNNSICSLPRGRKVKSLGLDMRDDRLTCKREIAHRHSRGEKPLGEVLLRPDRCEQIETGMAASTRFALPILKVNDS